MNNKTLPEKIVNIVTDIIQKPNLVSKYNKVDFNRLENFKYKKETIYFVKVLTENFSKEDLVVFYNNINELKIEVYNQGEESNRNVKGQYSVLKNTIYIYISKIDLRILYHELLHLASSFCDEEMVYSGFSFESLKKLGISLGKGINEGYTELLRRRYFYNDADADDTGDAYEYELSIAKKLEILVGQEIMESLYFNCNLRGLIEELMTYSTVDNIIKFISDVDYLNNFRVSGKKVTLLNKRKIGTRLKRVNEFLLYCYFKKLKIRQDAGEFETENEVLEDSKRFIDLFPTSITINNIKITLMEPGYLSKIADRAFLDKDEKTMK